MANELKNNLVSETLVTDLKQIILQARQGAYAAVNACMISTYWKIGQRIVEEEQQGKTRAEYGKGQLQELAKILTLEFGKGFDDRRLRDYRQFYLYFPEVFLHTQRFHLTELQMLLNAVDHPLCGMP